MAKKNYIIVIFVKIFIVINVLKIILNQKMGKKNSLIKSIIYYFLKQEITINF